MTDKSYKEVAEELGFSGMDAELFAMALESERSFTEKDFLKRGKFHSKEVCVASRVKGTPEHCFLHNPSEHKMRDWPIVVRSTTLIERTCEHGVGHPDPDSAAYLNWYYKVEKTQHGWGVHGCDGCCTPEGHIGSRV